VARLNKQRNDGPVQRLRGEWGLFQQHSRAAASLKQQPELEKLQQQVADLAKRLEGYEQRIVKHQQDAKQIEDQIYQCNQPEPRKYTSNSFRQAAVQREVEGNLIGESDHGQLRLRYPIVSPVVSGCGPARSPSAMGRRRGRLALVLLWGWAAGTQPDTRDRRRNGLLRHRSWPSTSSRTAPRPAAVPGSDGWAGGVAARWFIGRRMLAGDIPADPNLVMLSTI
jgi:hypothetical protein